MNAEEQSNVKVQLEHARAAARLIQTVARSAPLRRSMSQALVVECGLWGAERPTLTKQGWIPLPSADIGKRLLEVCKTVDWTGVILSFGRAIAATCRSATPMRTGNLTLVSWQWAAAALHVGEPAFWPKLTEAGPVEPVGSSPGDHAAAESCTLIAQLHVQTPLVCEGMRAIVERQYGKPDLRSELKGASLWGRLREFVDTLDWTRLANASTDIGTAILSLLSSGRRFTFKGNLQPSDCACAFLKVARHPGAWSAWDETRFLKAEEF